MLIDKGGNLQLVNEMRTGIRLAKCTCGYAWLLSRLGISMFPTSI